MDSLQFPPRAGVRGLVVARVAERQWHALDDDQVVGRGEASARPDGRLFLSIDAWQGDVFDRLAGVMLDALPRPLYTVVDEGDRELTGTWQRVGFAVRRREWEYVLPTDPHLSGLAAVRPPAGVTTLPVGAALEGPLRALDRLVRAEVEAAVGWAEMPAEVLVRPFDPTRYAVAARAERYVGLLRLVPLRRQPRIGLLAVHADERRRGVGRALLADVLGSLHRLGMPTAAADVNESNVAATALVEGAGGRRTGSNLELVLCPR